MATFFVTTTRHVFSILPYVTTHWIVQTCQMKEIVQVSIYYWPKELNVDVQGLNNIFYERNGCVVLNRSAFLCSIHEWFNILDFWSTVNKIRFISI